MIEKRVDIEKQINHRKWIVKTLTNGKNTGINPVEEPSRADKKEE